MSPVSRLLHIVFYSVYWGKEDLMANSEMILRLLTDLKIEQQLLKEQLEKMQTAVTILEEKSVTLKEKPATLKEKTMTPEEKPSVTKQRAFSGRPTSFRDWRASSQKN
ncbi:hypothetical protein CN520_30195 [Bacillus cereus]|uniref:Protein-export membrane protein-related protein n=3 Tax=Bacillus cereus group TaxID=86661 RepID=A0A9X7CXN0_BACCE|nr:hypothetical protein BK713_11415 [Bacillus thuringiensis serovar jinghongiensis]OTX12050.1 hypothetical protein BK715_24290 [Bacillus thuringiensis serovar japonensis]OTX36734.1 hypothetical protein BK718_10930 [Bacillus thuringiensis serovar andalousiensis]OTY58417.1 hypothetical protein BK746_13320 [Bacillus thuringiensis serovar yosoo]OTZ24861.1 hypothetical protein BK759_03580 [Bacillus thuringiensis serovar aizawai]OTZ96726.1 hypothetical protein BK774_26735 [Bacillus thuringiensis]PD